MSTKVPIPFFPSAPNEYDANYITQIVRAFALYEELKNEGGEARKS